MQYSEKDVAKLISDVEQAFTSQLAKAKETSLAKSEDGEKDHKEEPKHEEKPEHKEEAKHDGEDKKEESEHHEEPKHEEHKEHDEKGHDYDEEDMAHMEKMYRSMSKGEIEAHHGCIMKCMGKSEAKPAEMEKNEAEGHKNGGEMSACEPKDGPGAKEGAAPMEKSEVEVLKSELEDQKKMVEGFKQFLTKFVEKTSKVAPQGKAITSLDVIAKSEMHTEEKKLNKSEIHKILSAKANSATLEKTDRDAINSYYLNGQLNVNSISHLLK